MPVNTGVPEVLFHECFTAKYFLNTFVVSLKIVDAIVFI